MAATLASHSHPNFSEILQLDRGQLLKLREMLPSHTTEGVEPPYALSFEQAFLKLDCREHHSVSLPNHPRICTIC